MICPHRGAAIVKHCAIVKILRIVHVLSRSIFSTAGSFGCRSVIIWVASCLVVASIWCGWGGCRSESNAGGLAGTLVSTLPRLGGGSTLRWHVCRANFARMIVIELRMSCEKCSKLSPKFLSLYSVGPTKIPQNSRQQ